MAAQFRIFSDPEARLRFQLIAGNGDVLLTSEPYETQDQAIAAIWSVRDAAVRGRIIDHTGLVS
jgi:uncharacterized protein YegP (UPF0339 family)